MNTEAQAAVPALEAGDLAELGDAAPWGPRPVPLPSADELRHLPTLATGPAEDLKMEAPGGLRYWLERRPSPASGHPAELYGTMVLVERLEAGSWREVARYDSAEVEPDE